MKKFLIGLILGSTLFIGSSAYALSIFGVPQGGTGAGTFSAGRLLYGSGTSALQTVATTTASCSGSASCSTFTVIGSSPVTISATGGVGGSGTVATSTHETPGTLSYWTSNSGTPARLGKVATSSITYSSPFTTSGTAGYIVGGSGFTLGLDTTGTWSGNAGSATKLATARAINGVNFDGTGPITIFAASSTLLANNNTFSGSDIFSNAPKLGSLTGIIKGSSGTLSAASNGTDYTLITAKTCTGTDKVSAVTAAGVFTCTTDQTGTGSGTVATSTHETAGQVPYWTTTSGTPAKLGQIATGTVSSGTGISVTASRYVLNGGLTITNTSPLSSLTTSFPLSLSGTALSWTGLATSSALSAGKLVYATGVKTLAPVSTTTASCSGSASCTPFTVIGSSPVTISASGGAGSIYPFTPTAHWGQTTSATSTALWLRGSPFSLFASSTAAFTRASTTQLTVADLFAPNGAGLNVHIPAANDFVLQAGGVTDFSNDYIDVGDDFLQLGSKSAILELRNSTNNVSAKLVFSAISASSKNFTFPNVTGTFALGTGSTGNCAQWSSTNVLTAAAAPCGSGGSAATVATSTHETAGNLAYWTTTSGTPAKLGKVATTTLSGSGAISVTAGAVVIGGSAISVSCATCNTSNATVSSISTNNGLTGGTITTTGTIGLANIAAGTVLGNNSAGTTFPSAVATSTFFGTPTAGKILSFQNGKWQGVATTTFASPLSYSAATNQVSCSTCLTANQSITLSGDVSGTGSTAITTTIGANKVTVGMLATLAANSLLGNKTGATGNVTAVATSTLFGTPTPGKVLAYLAGKWQAAATTTAGTGLTYSGGAFNVNTSQSISTLSNLTSNGLIKTSGGTGALSIATPSTDYAPATSGSTVLLGNGSGGFSTFGGTSCTNQFVRSLSTAGAATCATVGASDVSLAALTATDSTLTFSGSYTGATARTIGLNLGNANTWTAKQTFGAASTTQLTASGYLGIPVSSTQTPAVAGQMAIDSTSGQLKYSDVNGTTRVLSTIQTRSFSYATSTWTGTTTLRIAPAAAALTVKYVYCETDVGTVGVSLYDGTTRANYIKTASTTINKFTYSTNNSFTAGKSMRVDVGTPASSPHNVACTFAYTYDAD